MYAGRSVQEALQSSSNRPLLLSPTAGPLNGAELDERVARLAGYLADRGLERSRIGLAYRNSFSAIEAFLAVERVGGTRIPVDADLVPSEARSMLDAAGVRAVLADREHAEGFGEGTLIHDDDRPLAGNAYSKQQEVGEEDAFMVYPRSVAGGSLFGVTISYGNWRAIMDLNCKLYRDGWYGPAVADDDVLITVQQIMHGTGMVATFPFLLLGLPQVVLPRFHADTLLGIIDKYRATTFFAVPGMLTRLARLLDESHRDITANPLPLRRTLYGGAPLTTAELRYVIAHMGGSLVQLYGRMEAGWPLAILGQPEHAEIAAGDEELASSCGRFIPDIEMRLATIPNRPSGEGELQTRNAMVCAQYADHDGWCSLGDVAHIDSGNYVHLAGRLDDMINTGSYHVYPRQVEEEIRRVAGVKAVKVRGTPDPKWGQAVTAFIVPEDPTPWADLVAAVDSHLKKRLAKYKLPKVYHKVDRLP
ncbi:MAG: class I adenylate-forming enzyme family protein [Acetobacteraceae bacterium]